MPYETMILGREEGFAVLTLNRPPANAISEALMRELNAVLSEIFLEAVPVVGLGDEHHVGVVLVRPLRRDLDRTRIDELAIELDVPAPPVHDAFQPGETELEDLGVQ